MTDYNTPPPGDPSGQNPYGQNPYGAPQPGQPIAGGAYAHWGKRVGAYLIDYLLYLPGIICYMIAGAMSGSVETTIDPDTGMIETSGGGMSAGGLIFMLLGLALVLAVFVWNVVLKQGQTGYTIGKGVLGIKLIKEDTGQPIGPGMAFVRYIAHIADSICCVGYLWPLWDPKRQTFADKIVSTVVIEQPKG